MTQHRPDLTSPDPDTVPTCDPFPAALAAVRQHAAKLTAENTPIFTTDASALFDLFLLALPPTLRRHYTCRSCARFFDLYGGLVVIGPSTGATTPLMWPQLDAGTLDYLDDAVAALHRAVARARVTGVFYAEAMTLGITETPDRARGVVWRHFSAPNPKPHRDRVKSAGQLAAEKLEDFAMLRRGLEEFELDTFRQAQAMLESEALPRSNRHRELSAWLVQVKLAQDAVKHDRNRDNLLWLAVAGAPVGWCHVRSGLIGTLLEDIAAGMPFNTLRQRWQAKIDPLHYMRPQAAPAAGALKRAEELVAKLGIETSLPRRFATLDDVTAGAELGSSRLVWRPAIEPVATRDSNTGGGVFSHLTPRQAAAKATDSARTQLPAVRMTFEKFRRTLLTASTYRLEILAEDKHTNFGALVTAVNPDAPPIVQWDRPDKRNPVSWYVYHGGSRPSAWNLTAGTWHEVQAVTMRPSTWHDSLVQHHGVSAMFIIRGCRDSRKSAEPTPGGGLFPECIRSELHEVRSVLEAYYRDHVIADAVKASACGLIYGQRSSDVTLRVTTAVSQQIITLDRWD